MKVFALQVSTEGRRAVRYVRRALCREHHVVGVEVAAVVKLHTLAQFELPGGIVDHLPGDCQIWDQILALILEDQRVVDVAGERIVRPQIVVVRVHRRWLGEHADTYRLGVGCNAGKKRADGDRK